MASYKSCVERHCKNCTYDPAQPGTWRFQTEGCTVTTCALWEVRPVTGAEVAEQRKAKAVEINFNDLINGLPDDEDETVV